MTNNVLVLGLPADAVFTKLIYSFKGLFRKININKFWIREVSAVYGANYNQMTVEFTSNTEARKARNFLNNLPFVYGKMEYHLQAEMAQDSMPYKTDDRVARGEQWGRGRGRRAGKRERPRSRSPGYSREASKLDMEIELLRKQRQVIEEERRLLLEQKKLEMIKEYGSTATREYSDFEDYESYESLEPPRKRRQPEPVRAKIARRSPPPTQKPSRNRPNGLPLFFQPCRRLMSDMKPYIEKDTTVEEVEILEKLIRAAIRKKIAIALEGKGFMQTKEILKLYREKHPREEDEAFVGKILSNVRASFLVEPKVETDEVDAVKVKGESVAKIEESDAKDKGKEKGDDNDKEKVAEGEEVAKEAQETPANGENGTDTTAPDDDTNVKSEIDVTQELENVSAGNISADVNADILDIKTNYSMINNTVGLDETKAANKVEDMEDVIQELENVSAGNISADVNADILDIKTNDSMINNTVGLDETEAENKVEDVQTQGEADWVEEQ